MSALAKWPRFVKAAAIVGAIVIAVPISSLFNGALFESTDASHVDRGIDAAGLVAGLDPRASLERLEEFANAVPSALPHYFEEEIGLPAGASDVRVSSDGSIVGCVIDGEVEKAHQLVSQRMVASGWSEVDLGAVRGSTYMKSTGSCRWALTTLTQVGSATSIVYRCVVE